MKYNTKYLYKYETKYLYKRVSVSIDIMCNII